MDLVNIHKKWFPPKKKVPISFSRHTDFDIEGFLFEWEGKKFKEKK